jgi:hypothetical protein
MPTRSLFYTVESSVCDGLRRRKMSLIFIVAGCRDTSVSLAQVGSSHSIPKAPLSFTYITNYLVGYRTQG